MGADETILATLLAWIARDRSFLGVVLAHPKKDKLRLLWSAETFRAFGITGDLKPKRVLSHRKLPKHLAAALAKGFVPLCLLSLRAAAPTPRILTRTTLPWPTPEPWTPATIDRAVRMQTARLRFAAPTAAGKA